MNNKANTLALITSLALFAFYFVSAYIQQPQLSFVACGLLLLSLFSISMVKTLRPKVRQVPMGQM